MPFTLNANLTGVFADKSGSGPIAQNLPLNAQAIATIIGGINPDGTPAGSIANQNPQPQAPPITRQPFTIAGILDTMKRNPVTTLAIVGAVVFLYLKAR